MPAALGAPDSEEHEFLETLRRIFVRSAAEELWDKYHAPLSDGLGRLLAESDD